MEQTGANATVVFVPPAFVKGAVVEAIDAGIPLAVVITEGIPVHDTTSFWAYQQAQGGRTRIVGPNCPGVISPGRTNLGDRKSTRLNSSHANISYAVFCLKKKKKYD